MELMTVDGVGLAYEVRGDGEPVVLIHAGVCADFFTPLMDQPALSGYRLLRYHRVGYGSSDRVDGPFGIGRQGALCRSFMNRLGIDRAHVVGHSSSATMAVELALAAPAAVRTVALLEMALMAVPSGSFAAEAIGHYGSGDRRAAVDTWLRGVCGPDYREALDRALPGAFDRAVGDADAFFAQELPAVRDWTFGPAEASRVGQPALVVLGGRSDQVSAAFTQRYELLLAWLPHAEPFVLPDATHLLQVQNPAGLAGGLAAFLARHPIGPSPGRQ
jgi:pimeloyl-ACP methyl ester carboxylesterase